MGSIVSGITHSLTGMLPVNLEATTHAYIHTHTHTHTHMHSRDDHQPFFVHRDYVTFGMEFHTGCGLRGILDNANVAFVWTLGDLHCFANDGQVPSCSTSPATAS